MLRSGAYVPKQRRQLGQMKSRLGNENGGEERNASSRAESVVD